MSDLIPWNRTHKVMAPRELDPIGTLQGEMNRLFDEFFADPFKGTRPFGGLSQVMSAFSPRIDVNETEEEVVISAELPGMDDKTIQVSLADNAITLSG